MPDAVGGRYIDPGNQGRQIAEHGKAIAQLQRLMANRPKIPQPSVAGTLGSPRADDAVRQCEESRERARSAVDGLGGREVRDLERTIEQHRAAEAAVVHQRERWRVRCEQIGVPLVSDKSMQRGCVRLETADGWVEDGPDVRLARLRALMDDMEGKA